MKPHIEFLDGIMLSSTRDIAPSCVENVDELIERQEKSLVQLDSKKNIVNDLIEKGKVILEHPDKPKFLEGNVKRIQEGWDDTKKKAQDRLKLLQDTKEAWVGYADNNETIAQQFEVAEEEIKMVKKRYNLEDALADLKRDRTCTTRATTPSLDFSRASMTTLLACPSLSPRTRRRLWTRRSRPLTPSLRLSHASRTLLRLLRTSALPSLTLTPP